MRPGRVSILLTILLAAPIAAQTSAPPSRGTTGAAITAADMKTRITFLAHDALKGRDTPSPGLEMAATYIADEFKRLGLQPAGDSGTYIQRFPYQSVRLRSSDASLELRGNGTPKSLKLGEEWFVLPAEGRDTTSGSVVYVGNAGAPRPLPEAARGQIAAFYVPGTKLDAEWQQGVVSVLGPAIQGGAKGVLIVLDPGFTAENVGNLQANLGGQVLPVPLVGVRYDVMKQFMASAGADLDALRNAPPAAPAANPALAVAFKAAVTDSSARVPNVVAMLPGSDPTLKDEYVILTAHFDHVGVGQPDAAGDSIFNGADDDASGTSAILEVAEAFATAPQKPKRSLIFLLVSGEEKGLLGSRYYAENMKLPPEKVVTNINIDMIGRNNPDSVVAIGQDYSDLGPIVQEVARRNASQLKLTVAPDLWPEEMLFFRSDHFSFAIKDIPAIFFTTGLHDDYHKQSDEVDTIDTNKSARIASLVYELGRDVANRAQPPKWTEAGRKAMQQIRQMQSGGN